MHTTPERYLRSRLAIAAICALLALLGAAQTLNAQYVGSRKSDKYHKKDCQHARRIHAENLVEWKTIDDAKAAGYVACKTCRPGSGTGTGGTRTSTNSSGYDRGGASSSTNSTSTRCQATTQRGTQCKRNAQPGGSYCWQHQR